MNVGRFVQLFHVATSGNHPRGVAQTRNGLTDMLAFLQATSAKPTMLGLKSANPFLLESQVAKYVYRHHLPLLTEASGS